MKKSRNASIGNTGERMVPEFDKHQLVYAEHITRYTAAEPFIKDKIVLDIASGSGYGTSILGRKAKKVYGVDISEEAVRYAKSVYGAKNIEFKVGSGTSIPLEDNTVDVLTTFETIEHIEDYETFMGEIGRVVKPNGTAIISTPNDVEFPEGAHYHVHEFEYEELLRLVKKQFKYVDEYFQATWRYVVIGDEKLLGEEWDEKLRTLNLAPLKKEKYLYFYLVCSNEKITTKLEPLAATGQHHSDREMIATAANANQQLVERQKHIDELWDIINKTNEQLKGVKDELQKIKASKSYKVMNKLSNIKKGKK